MTKLDISRASVETCREVARIALQMGALQGFAAMTKLRAECTVAPLRTRAEVDAETLGKLRRYAAMRIEDRDGSGLWQDIERLCAEPTADPEPERSDPDPAEARCGCPPSAELEREVERLRAAIELAKDAL
jgi:hypothetical protein